jgi:hypothetical protein
MAEQKVFLFGREGISGEDETLGFEIFVAMIESLARRKEPPAALVFWNTAVRLLTGASPVLKQLEALEEKGVALVAGKLCLSELEIPKLAVGRAGTMDEILDLFQKYGVVSL